MSVPSRPCQHSTPHLGGLTSAVLSAGSAAPKFLADRGIYLTPQPLCKMARGARKKVPLRGTRVKLIFKITSQALKVRNIIARAGAKAKAWVKKNDYPSPEGAGYNGEV